MLRKTATMLGAVLLVAGIAGFIPALTTMDDAKDPHVLGLFEAGTLHNIIHIASGLAALFLAKSVAGAKLYFKVFGVVYGLVTILGLVGGDNVLGLFDINLADNLLHIAITVVALYLGFVYKADNREDRADV